MKNKDTDEKQKERHRRKAKKKDTEETFITSLEFDFFLSSAQVFF